MQNVLKAIVLTLSLLLLSAAAQKPVKIIIMGDNRQQSHNGEQTIAFRKTIKMVAAENADYVLHTGDFIRGYTSDMSLVEKWYDEWQHLTAPIADRLHIAAGNHDIWSPASFEVYKKKIGKTYYSKDIGPAHLILLNSWLPDAPNQISGQQFEWLEKDLKTAQNKKFIFVFIHSPAYPVGPHIGSSLDEYPKQRDRLWNLLKQYKVNVLFCGHEHLYNDQTRDNIRQIITGGAGSNLYGKKRDGAFYHYLRMTVTEKDYNIETVLVEDPMELAQDYLEKRKSASRAIPLLEIIRKEFPESADVYAYLGIGYEKMKNYAQADEQFAKFLKKRNYDPRAFKFMFEEMEDYDADGREGELIRNALKINPDEPALHLVYAHRLLLDNKVNEAEGQLQKLLQNDPDNVEVIYNLGLVHELRAKEFYDKIRKIDPEGPLAEKARKRIKYIKRAFKK